MDSDSSELILPTAEDVMKAVEAENAQSEKSFMKDSNCDESEKENKNGKENFKSPSKIHHSAMAVTVEETERELKYRNTYFKDESEVVTSLKLRCTACYSSLQSVVLEGRDVFHHPVLRVLMCKTCVEFYGDGNFSVDEDGSDKYCRWCGQGGTLYCCSTCCSAFCKRCIKRNLNRSIFSDIVSEDWQCFVCNVEPLWELRAICTNAQSYSRMIRRNKREENRHNLKQLQKKQSPLKRKSQLLAQKNFSTDSSSDNDSNLRRKQKSSKNRCKQNNGSPVYSDGGKKGDKQKLIDCDSHSDSVIEIEVPKDNKKVDCVQLSGSEESEKKVKNGSVTESHTSLSDSEEGSSGYFKEKKSKHRLKEVVCSLGAAMGVEKRSKSQSEQESGTTEDKKIPKEVDEKSAKLACVWLDERIQELVCVSKILRVRAQRCMEKKVHLKSMTNPQNVDSVVNSLHLLVKLAKGNLEHIDNYLSFNYKYWVKRVIRHSSSETGANVSSASQQGYQGKNKKIVTKNSQSSEDVCMSVNGVCGDNIELHSLPENGCDNGGIENREADNQESGILSEGTVKSVEMRGENSNKRKLLQDAGDSDDKEVVHSGDIEGDLQKSVTRDTKRKKLEHGLEDEVDLSVGTYINSSVNYTKSECAMKRSNKPESDMELEDCTTAEDTCMGVTEDGGDTETEKISDRNKNLNVDVDSSQNEEKISDINQSLSCDSLENKEEISNRNKNLSDDLSQNEEKVSGGNQNLNGDLSQNEEKISDRKTNLSGNSSRNEDKVSDRNKNLNDSLQNEEKISDRMNNLNGDSLQNEDGIVAENSIEHTSSLHETDELAQSETNFSGGSSIYEADNRSEKSFESLSTLLIRHHGQNLPICEVSDISKDMKKTDACMEDAVQENQPEKSDEEQDYAKLNAESEAKRGDGGDAIDEGSEKKGNEKVSESDSDSDAATVECLFDMECEKSQSDESEANEKNEELHTVDSSADDSKTSVKRLPEGNEKMDREVDSCKDTVITPEVPDSLVKDSLAAVHSHGVAVADSEEDREDFEVQKNMTKSIESDVEENRMDICEDPERCTENKDKQEQKVGNDLEEDKINDLRKLEMSDDLSECEGEEKDTENDEVKVKEEKTEVEVKLEERAVDALKYTADCLKAQQALLEYTTDDEDSCTETPLRKKKKKEQSKKAKEKEVVCKDTKPARKRCIGPKSQTRKGRRSTTTSSVSSATDVDSDCSIELQHIKVDGSRKKKFKLKATEEYKQDEKLGWKSVVLVERLPDEVFQKHYEQYYSDEESKSEKRSNDDKEIDSLVNLKSLKKVRTNKFDADDSDSEDSDDTGKRRAKKKTEKPKMGEEEKLISFLNRIDDSNDDNLSSDLSDSEKEEMKAMKLKKSLIEKENEMAMKMLLGSSTDDDTDFGEKDDDSKEEEMKKKAKVKTEKTEDVSEEDEEKKHKAEVKKADSGASGGGGDDDDDDDDDDIFSDGSQKKRDWRKDKLLTQKLSDPDTSDEERRWKMKKEREQEEDNNDSEERARSEAKPRKKKVRRQILDSDDSDVIISSSDRSSSDDFIIKKRKRPSKKTNSDTDKTSDSDVPRGKKTKRKRIKAPASDSSNDEESQVELSQKSDTPGKGRKNIHRIMKDENVGEATRRAAREEEERKKRIAEKQKMYNEIYKEVEGVEKCEKLVLDFDPETKEELVSVDPFIVSKLKPHQVKGVKYMWDACFESLKQIEKTKGSGCILAHCMGLGKTLQVVALVHTLLKHKATEVNTVLVVSPLNTVLNWVNEFSMWLKDVEGGEDVNVFELSRYRQNYERMYQLKEWQSCRGVMVIGYEMFRNLTNTQVKRMRKSVIETFQSTLVDPGPDLVVCDEGHLLKNEDTALSKAMRKIRTLRRIVLTGTPLQNNLKEYHCMVQFVKPNLLGTRKEFQNRFMNPISNGQFEDSTAHDVKVMKRRAHVLHKMLEGSVQRFDYSVLTPFLPPKHEFVISIRLSEVQIKAYRYYLEHCTVGRTGEKTKGTQLFNDFQNLSRIWTHPRVLQLNAEKAEKTAERKRLMESDSEGSLRDFIADDDDDNTTESSDKSSNESDGSNHKPVTRITRSKLNNGLVEEPEGMEVSKGDEEDEKSKPLAWWKQFIDGDELENMKYSGKLILLFSILRECEKIGDKVLVFSQSLYSLDLIEYFLASVDAATQEGETKESLCGNTGSWSIGLDYFRLDGSSSSENRNAWCKMFNREDNHRARLFIISTRAGGLGINLFAANRVIIFDASWNPSHDVQSIFRVYRFGQKKPCYIYRFLAQGTMEEKIYDRQIAKLSLSCRVVDEQQIERHYNMADLQELYQFNPEQKTKRPTPLLPKDRLLAELLKEHEQWIVTYHEHDSLLENKEEEELNEEERKVAWEEYENEKQGKTISSVVTGMPTLNMAAIRERLRSENPHATQEQLEQKLNSVVDKVYEYLNSSQAAASSQNYQTYTAAQLQALQQYRIQQEQLKRAQQQEILRMRQESIMQATANYNNADVTFRQYLQEQQQANQNLVVYPTNLYRNVAVDKSGMFRMQSKLVPIGAPSTSSRSMVPNLGGKDMVRSQTISRHPVILPLARPSTSVMQPPPAHSNTPVNLLQEFLKHQNIQQPVGSTTSTTDEVIETID